MHIVIYLVNTVTPRFVYHGFSTFNALDKGAGIWILVTRVRRPSDVAHWSAPDNAVRESTAVGDAVSAKSDYNYKTDFKI